MSKLRTDELVNKEGDGSPSFPYGATSTEPTLDNQVATKSYVDNSISGSLGNTVSSTAPASPAIGTFWTDTSVSPSLLKVWNGSVWLELSGEVSPYTGFIGSPVEVLTPLDGAGVGGAITFQPVSEPIVSGPDRELNYGTQSISTQVSGFSNVEYSSMSSNGSGTTIMTPYYSSAGAPYGITYQTDWGWNRGFSPTAGKAFKDSIWTGTRFVVISQDAPYVTHSTDGITWTSASNAKSGSWKKIVRNDVTGRLLVSSEQSSTSNRYMYSDDDGDTWTYSSGTVSGNSGGWLAYGNGVFALLPNRSSHGEWSNDGINWTQANIDSLDNYRTWTGVDYDPIHGVFLAMGYRSRSQSDYQQHQWARSSDGKSWDQYTTQTMGNAEVSYSYKGLKWVNDRFLVGGYYFREYLFEITDAYTLNSVISLPTHPNDSGYRFPNNYCWTGKNYFIHSHSSGEYFYYTSGNSPGGVLAANRASFGNSNYADNRYIYEYYDVAGTNVYKTSDDSIVQDATFEEFFNTTIRKLGTTENKGNTVTGPTTFRISYKWNGSSQGFYTGDRIQRYNTVTQYGPSPSDITFTSQNVGTTPFNGTDATLAFRKWTLETRASSLDPWTLVVESDDYSIVDGQDGSTPWSLAPVLQPNTSYRVKVAYHSANADPVESAYSTFQTGPAS